MVEATILKTMAPRTWAPGPKEGDDVLTRNAYQTLRISLAAVAALLLFAQSCLPAHYPNSRRDSKTHHRAKRYSTSVLKHRNTGKHAATKVTKLTKTTRADHAGVYGHSRTDGLEIQSDGMMIGLLAKSERFVILERDGDRFNVKLSNGQTGSVLADAVEIVDTRKPLEVSDSWSMKRNLVRTAYAFRGARYRSGGMGSGGFDCSGFVKYLYAKQGIKLPHSSRAQYGYGKSVSKSELMAGDVVFFSGTYRRGISHVGMYIGDGKFIHASTHKGGVRIDNLDSAYYRGKYAGARRLE